MLIASARKKAPFRDRFARGLVSEARVVKVMAELGYMLHRTGHDTYPGRVKTRLKRHGDPTSRFLRFLPDFFSVTESGSFYVEVKSNRRNTGYFALNVDELEAQKALTRLGVRILVIFESGQGFRAQWLDRLQVLRVCPGSSTGSGKPYALVSERSLPLLDQILLQGTNNG